MNQNLNSAWCEKMIEGNTHKPLQAFGLNYVATCITNLHRYMIQYYQSGTSGCVDTLSDFLYFVQLRTLLRTRENERIR